VSGRAEGHAAATRRGVETCLDLGGAEAWLQTFRDAPLPGFNTPRVLEPGVDYWFFVTGEAVLAP
jgi:hypothetical protein